LNSKVKSANPHILGNHVVAGGTDFAIWAPAADAVELCLFDLKDGRWVETKFSLAHRDGPIWHGHLANITDIESTDLGALNKDGDLIPQKF
jgi:pullulanase/glycogen debranching enzyme